MEMDRFVFCALVCTSTWVHCPAQARGPELNRGAQLGGHLERLSPPFNSYPSGPVLGWPLAESIIAGHFQTHGKGSQRDRTTVPSSSHISSDDRTLILLNTGETVVKSSTKEQNTQRRIKGSGLNGSNSPSLKVQVFSEKSKAEDQILANYGQPNLLAGRKAEKKQVCNGTKVADTRTGHVNTETGRLNPMTPVDNAPGMQTMGVPEMKSAQDITATVGGNTAKGENAWMSETKREKADLLWRPMQQIFLVINRFARVVGWSNVHEHEGNGHRVRRSSQNTVGSNGTDTEQTTTPPGTESEYNGNITGLSGMHNALDQSSSDSRYRNMSVANPTATNVTDDNHIGGVSVALLESDASGFSNYSSITDVSSDLDGQAGSPGGRAVMDLNDATDETGTAEGNFSDLGINEISTDPLAGVVSSASSDLVTTQSTSSKILATDPTKIDNTKTLQTKTGLRDGQSPVVVTTPSLHTTKSMPEKQNKEGLSPTKTSDMNSSVRSEKTDSVAPTRLSSDIIGIKATGSTPLHTDQHGNPIPGASKAAEPRTGPVLSSFNVDDKTTQLDSPGPTASNGETKSEVSGSNSSLDKQDLNSDPEPEPEPEPESEPEPENPTTPEGVDLLFPSAEPGPDWVLAKAKWNYAWEIHIYVFGGLFGLLGLYSLLSTIRLWRIQRLLSKGYFLSLNCLMLLLCGCRSFYLLYDGYNSNGSFPISLNYFLYSIIFPCLTSAFSILLYALLKATNMKLVSPSVQKIQILAFIIIVHFLISITTDVLIGLYAGTQVMLFVCQVYFILWGLFLFFSYAYIFRKLYSHALKRQKAITYTSPHRTYSVNQKNTRSKFTLSAAIKVTFFTAICGLITVGLEIYAIVGVYKTFTRDRPKPWPWWLYHTVLRLIEFLMSVTMTYVASQPFRYLKSENKCSCGVLCAPCSEILCCGSSINRSSSVSGWDHFDHETTCDLAGHGLNGGSMTGSSSKKLVISDDVDAIPIVDLQPVSGSRPNSLLIIEDGYVRFHTEHDVNRIVDSQKELSQSGENVHNMNTFPLREGFVNTGYSYNADENKIRVYDDGITTTKEEEKSLKGSFASTEFFRVPSSVSLAESMENEMVKAFESFKLDTSGEVEEEPDQKSLDFIVVSDIENLKETDLISVDSLPESTTIDKAASSGGVEEPRDNPQPELNPGHRAFTLLRRAKSSEVGENRKVSESPEDPYLQQKLYRSYSDQSTRSGGKDSANVKYSCLLDLDTKENRVLNSEGNDLDNEIDFVSPGRRPSEGQGNQAAILTSLLRFKDAGDNIEV